VASDLVQEIETKINQIGEIRQATATDSDDKFKQTKD